MKINFQLCFLIPFTLFFSNSTTYSQKYEPSWESLNQRPTPQWWKDAKFGIFIHWGVYSVPSYTSLGQYSEWYWKALTEENEDVVAFHKKVYGNNVAYQQFAPKFKAEFFDPVQWAKLFKRSGAGYVVLTSKHHDGYCLWPSKEANRSWGQPWNSLDTGPERDLVGDLSKAVKQAGLRMGLYYSLYEWFNPLYVADHKLYVEKHMMPQFKDVVERYEPAVIFSDGEWDLTSEEWRSTELLTWLFNESAVKDEVVINDRWGKNERHKNGGYYTTEYGSGLPDATHPWEESRGMAHSYALNRIESIDDYNSTQELLLMLIDIVSRGGNFLLDIGPAADGTIPVVMQERLVEMGNWLTINGEAIYGTSTWKNTHQWTDGKIPTFKEGDYMTGYDIKKVVLNPEPGFAKKELFFTMKENYLYVIVPQWPEGKKQIKDLKISPNSKITLLGTDKKLSWKQQGEDLIVDIPKINRNDLAVDHAWVLKISDIK